MTLWIFFIVMGVVAIGFVVTPLYRQQKKLTSLIAVVVVVSVAISAGLYRSQGSPDAPSAGSEPADVSDALASLAQKLKKNPDDLEGWKMLGRSYMAVENFAGAVGALEHAIKLDGGKDAETLTALGESLLAGNGGGIAGRVATLFENALSIDGDSQKALFYGGIGAFNRGDAELAATRWERLLSLNPPAEIEGVLRQRIAEWRGENVATAMPAGHPPITTETEPGQTPAPIEQPGVVLSVNVSIADTANVPAGAMAFLIARDPAQPSPPIAVKRLNTSDLPTTVNFADTDSMVAGRSLSGFAEVELIVRVSMSGQRTQQSGDWIGVRIVKPTENKNVTLVIDEQVP
jgi:cytochrome c-type biogenesis protein CcmH